MDNPNTMKHVIAYRLSNGMCPFQEWHKAIANKAIRAIVADRVRRIASGLAGDCKSVGDAVYELRIQRGPGYRIYFAYHGEQVLLLLTGGEKSSQRQDIEQAKAYFKDYKRRKQNDAKR